MHPMRGFDGATFQRDVIVFFFSSRRRHTRCSRDWSSDVCSSDLVLQALDDGMRADAPEVEALQPREDRGRTLGDLLRLGRCEQDRKSTRLNSSHGYISYAVFCLKKKKNNK